MLININNKHQRAFLVFYIFTMYKFIVYIQDESKVSKIFSSKEDSPCIYVERERERMGEWEFGFGELGMIDVGKTSLDRLGSFGLFLLKK